MRISEALTTLRELRILAGNTPEAHIKADQIGEYIVLLFQDCENARDERVIKQEVQKFTPEILAGWATEVSEYRKGSK